MSEENESDIKLKDKIFGGILGYVAVRTFDLVFPMKVSNHFVALGIIDQSVNVQVYRVHEKQRTGEKGRNSSNCRNF